jgi:hypothetical protein
MAVDRVDRPAGFRRMATVACVSVDGLEGRWYPSESGYGDRERYEEDRYRLPEPRHAEPEALGRESRLGAVGPRSGVELPPLPTYGPEVPPYEPGDPTGEHHTTPIERDALRRPETPTPTPSPTVYKSRRAGSLVAVLAVAIVVELLLVRVLLVGEFGSVVQPGAVLGSIFAMTGVPFVAIGLHALINGPAATAGPEAVRGWLRTPLAYLPVGLVLLIAAGLAA